MSAVERGSQIDVTFSIPPLTNEGLALKAIGKIELRVGPNSGSSFQMNDWSAAAQPVDVPTPASPGFVRVPIPAEGSEQALLVPDTALGADQGGRYLLVVNADNVVEQRHVRTGPLDGGLRVIEEGLKADDRVVIEGLLRAIPGQKADPQLQKLETSAVSAK